MAPKTNRHSDKDWLSRKTEIRELFMEKDFTFPAVLQHLESQGFPVSKPQLEYKLKTWGFRKKLPKNDSQSGWHYIRHRVEKRKKQGKESEVILSGRRLDQQTVERESNRHHSVAWSSSFQTATSPRTPEGVSISICTPAALTMDFKWHNSLPWFQFRQKISRKVIPRLESVSLSIKKLILPVTVTAPMHLLGNVNVAASSLALLGLENPGSLQLKTSSSTLASRFESIMPESYEGENFDRAEKLARWPSNEATQELINITIFKLSNKLDTNLSWQQKLGISETSGIMSSRAQLNQQSDNSRTISALAENLYQDAFEFLYATRSHEAPEDCQSRSIKLIIWLLSLGYDSDTFMTLPDLAAGVTGLQIAMYCEHYDLAYALLDAGADPSLTYHRRYAWLYTNLDSKVSLPPLAIAMCCKPSPGKKTILRRLLVAGADVGAEVECEDGFMVKISMLSILAGFANEEEDEFQAIMDMLCIGKAKPEFVTADVLISAAWNGRTNNLILLLRVNPDVNMANALGLTALHAAAHQGHTGICTMLLERGACVDYPDQGAPSPLHLACSQNHTEIVTILREHGASLFRGITVTGANRDLVFRKYFEVLWSNIRREALGIFPEGFTAMVESPTGAAALASDFESESVIAYLVQHGAQLPNSTVFFAASRRFPRLLSLALRQGLDANDRGPDNRTPLQAALSRIQLEVLENLNYIQIASDLLNAGAMVVGGEALLALGYLQSWDIVERILSSDHDHLAERYDLIPMKNSQIRVGTTLLETAILGGSKTLIDYALARKPSEYSARALCAACFQATKEFNTLALVEQLLLNRKNMASAHQEDLVWETTAVGLAAWRGDTAMLEVLNAYIPVSHFAYLPEPDALVRVALFTHLEVYNRTLAFVDDDGLLIGTFELEGSPVNYALDKPQILDQLFRCGYKLDRISLAVVARSFDTSKMRSLTQGRDVLTNEYSDKIHSPLYAAITKEDPEMMSFLLNSGEDVNDREDGVQYGRSPLARAVEMNNLSMIEMLLKAGADVNAPPAPWEGKTALQCAAAKGLLGIARRLIDLGADVNAPGCQSDGQTALEAAAERGRIDMVQFILSEGAETTGYHRRQYIRACGWAETGEHHATAKMLKEHRQWTDEDQLLWESESLFDDDEECREDDAEAPGMAPASKEEIDGFGAHSAIGEMVRETTGEEDGTDWGTSAWNASLANEPNLANQGVVAEPGFATEMDGMEENAIDWDSLPGNRVNSMEEAVAPVTDFPGDEPADLWFSMGI